MLDLQDFGCCVDLLVFDFGSPDLHGGRTIDKILMSLSLGVIEKERRWALRCICELDGIGK